MIVSPTPSRVRRVNTVRSASDRTRPVRDRAHGSSSFRAELANGCSVPAHGTNSASWPGVGHRSRQGRQAQAVPDRLLLHRRRQEVRHGDHRHHRYRLRHQPHDRQPQGVPRRSSATTATRPTTSTSTASSSARCSCRSCPAAYFLWVMRLVLIAAVLLHIHAAYSLTVLNRKARPVKYQSPRDYEVANFASRTMRWTGIIVLLFIAWHLADLTWGWANPDFEHGAVYRNLDRQPQPGAGGDLLHRRQHRARHPPLPRHVEPVPVDRLRAIRGSTTGARASPPASPRSSSSATARSPSVTGRRDRVTTRAPCPQRSRVAGRRTPTEVDHERHTRFQDPRRPAGRQVGQLQRPPEAGEPGEQAQVQDHRRRHRARRRLGGRHVRRTRLRGRGVHVPRLAAPCPLDRRPGRHQRRQELPGRRRQRLPALLRHGQGRRLPRPRSQRPPSRRGVGRTSSTRWSPRVCRSPASTAASSTTAASAAPRSAARSTPGARPASSCCIGAYQQLARQIGLGNVKLWNRMEMVDVVNIDGRCCRHRHPRPDDRRVLLALGARRRARHRWLRQRLLPVDERHELQRHRRLACAPSAVRRSPTRATRRSTRRASRRPTTSSPSSR